MLELRCAICCYHSKRKTRSGERWLSLLTVLRDPCLLEAPKGPDITNVEQEPGISTNVTRFLHSPSLVNGVGNSTVAGEMQLMTSSGI